MAFHSPAPGWTPEEVGRCLVEAVRWARYNAGPTGPASYKCVLPQYLPTFEERIEEGWLFDEAADLETKLLRINLSPAKVTANLKALEWVATYVHPSHPGLARVLNIWVRCRVNRSSFAESIDRLRVMSRATANRMKVRALSMIAQGLERDGIEPYVEPPTFDQSSVRWADE